MQHVCSPVAVYGNVACAWLFANIDPVFSMHLAMAAIILPTTCFIIKIVILGWT